MKLVVGLGNPGNRYVETRHNAGFLVLDLIAEEVGVSLNRKMFEAVYGEGELFQEPVVFVKPQTFMNLSGTSVRKWMQFYKMTSKDLIVLHDDIDMNIATVKAKAGGGHGGHNGIRSIIEETGQSDFFRIKLGVGKPAAENSVDKEYTVTSWVLGAFSEQELANLKTEMFKETMLRLQEIIRQGQPKKPKGDARA